MLLIDDSDEHFNRRSADERRIEDRVKKNYDWVRVRVPQIRLVSPRSYEDYLNDNLSKFMK